MEQTSLKHKDDENKEAASRQPGHQKPARKKDDDEGEIWVLPEGPKELSRVFHRLRVVDLVDISEECDLNWTVFILQGAPFLEELNIMVRDHLCEMLLDDELRTEFACSMEKKGVDWEGGTSDFKHHKLATLKVFGFRPEDRAHLNIFSLDSPAINRMINYFYLTGTLILNALQDAMDRLSKMPDDILVSVLERLNIREAARMGTLSRRLWHIPTKLNKIVIKVNSFDPSEGNRSSITFDGLSQANAAMAEATKSILAARKASQYAIHLLSLQFYLGDEALSVAQTVAGTMENQAVDAVEFAILTKKRRARCTIYDVFLHGRQLMLLVDACPNAFSYLTCIKLENVSLNEPDFPKIFSICKRLEFLRLDNCTMGILFFLEVEHLLLSELEIDNCRFERVHLKWVPRLATLTFNAWVSQEDPVSFGYVPLLQSVSLTNIGLSWHKMLKLSEVLGNATVSTLYLNFKSEKIWVQPEGPSQLFPIFHKLRRVSLINISEECDLDWTMFVLQGAPSLEELQITVQDHFCEMLRDEELRKLYAYSEEKKSVDWEDGASGFKHHKLVVLRIFGFRPQDKFVRYVRRVIVAAVNLEDIFLHNKLVCERCKHKVPKASRSPWPKKQRFSLRNRITSGTNSFVAIHFPSSSRD
ncbi:hypothetical protein HU200_040197 [Digitaria exilis]|uniref:F-box domain-containing protein n=1 Tax=Digitaria exilis TaxID=1010633 RepID=A0A835B891_9POAL|nr:hypothetical protein HU200_040197 [Digitaria exilis]